MTRHQFALRTSWMLAAALIVTLSGALSGCAGGKKWGAASPAVAEIKQAGKVAALWKQSVGSSAGAAFSAVFDDGAVFAADADGTLTRVNAQTGKEAWRIETKQKLSGGVGVGSGLVLVGTPKGEVLAFNEAGKALWRAQVSSEVLSPPQADDDIVVVRTLDGRVFGLNADDGKRKWVYQRTIPSLTVRSFAGVLLGRGAVFAGFAGGKLAAINLANGNVGWEATVAQPRGATELERITDVTSLPVMDGRQVCAVAYQGRIACFDVINGALLWAREVTSNAGLAMDADFIYVSDDRGAVVALNKNNGEQAWKQDQLGGGKLSAPFVYGDYVVVGDHQGNLFFLKYQNGTLASRVDTDGGAILARPEALPQGFVVQTSKGGIYAFDVQ